MTCEKYKVIIIKSTEEATIKIFLIVQNKDNWQLVGITG